MPILKVQADSDDVLVKFDNVIRIRRDNGWLGRGVGRNVIAATISVIAGRFPQINKQIFDFERPILGEGNFNSRAGCPAEFRIDMAGRSRAVSTFAPAPPAAP
jgi:hypothetical protein